MENVSELMEISLLLMVSKERALLEIVESQWYHLCLSWDVDLNYENSCYLLILLSHIFVSRPILFINVFFTSHMTCGEKVKPYR
jgi:hypothetical protein